MAAGSRAVRPSWRIRVRRRLEALRVHLLLASTASVPVVVYQMGKVGSSAVRDGLTAGGVSPVFHAHNLRPGVADPASAALRHWLVGRRRRARFVSLVRDPIARNVSAFFENFTRDAGMSWSAAPRDRLRDLFLERARHDEPLEWFDRQVLDVLGIDVYETRFPWEAGALELSGGGRDLLLLRAEMPDAKKSERLAAFLAVPAVPILGRNQTLDKPWGTAYRDFVERVRLPEEYVEALIGSRFTRHFYSPDERARLRERWIAGLRRP